MSRIRLFFAGIRRRFALTSLVIPGLVLGGVGGLLYALIRPPTYIAQAYVIVVAPPDAPFEVALNYAQAFGRIVRHPDTLARSTALGYPAVAPKDVRASTSPDTPMIQISGTAGTAARAAGHANAAADALIDYGNRQQRQTGVRLSGMSRAYAPAKPASPNLPVDVAVGASAGLLLGALITSGARGRCVERPGPPQPEGSGTPPAAVPGALNAAGEHQRPMAPAHRI